jgi:hypothetical protein
MAKEIVYSVDGTVNKQASLEALMVEQANELNEFEIELDKKINFYQSIIPELSRAVNVIFDRYPDKNIEIGPFTTLVLNQMEVDVFQQKDMKVHVMNFIHGSAEFKVFRGKNGGVRRVSDIKE